MSIGTYTWKILQNGALPLTIDGRVLPFQEHRCTSVLVWPECMALCPENSLIIDPCFTEKGLRRAKGRLQRLGFCLSDIGYAFVTHSHFDHTIHVPDESFQLTWKPYTQNDCRHLAGISLVPCPGHDPMLRAVRFTTGIGEVWVVGDAVLNKEWLTEWGYYWPNAYDRSDIVMTWRSVASIVSAADMIIPGHGAPIKVTASLIGEMLNKWPKARHADDCPAVEQALKLRLGSFQRKTEEF